MDPLTATLLPWLRTLEATGLATLVRSSTLAYPVAEIVHLIGLAILFGTVLLVDLAVLMQWRRFGLEHWGVIVLRFTLAGFTLAAATGLLMLMARATDIGLNRVFWAKMILLLLAGANAWLFHHRRGLQLNTRGIRAQALFSVLSWLAIIACGRMIAYV